MSHRGTNTTTATCTYKRSIRLHRRCRLRHDQRRGRSCCPPSREGCGASGRGRHLGCGRVRPTASGTRLAWARGESGWGRNGSLRGRVAPTFSRRRQRGTPRMPLLDDTESWVQRRQLRKANEGLAPVAAVVISGGRGSDGWGGGDASTVALSCCGLRLVTTAVLSGSGTPCPRSRAVAWCVRPQPTFTEISQLEHPVSAAPIVTTTVRPRTLVVNTAARSKHGKRTR